MNFPRKLGTFVIYSCICAMAYAADCNEICPGEDAGIFAIDSRDWMIVHPNRISEAFSGCQIAWNPKDASERVVLEFKSGILVRFTSGNGKHNCEFNQTSPPLPECRYVGRAYSKGFPGTSNQELQKKSIAVNWPAGQCLPTFEKRLVLNRCENLSIVQSGKEIENKDGIFRINRQPFVVRYRGTEKDPALTASTENQIAGALTSRGRKYVWASAGDYAAYAPGDLPLTNRYRIFADEKSRNEFASMIGDKYVDLLQSMISSNPELDTATFIPKVGGDFKLDAASNSYIYEIEKVDGQPVSQTSFDQLYVAYFGTVERYGPPNKGLYQYQDLIKMGWGACVISFNK